jgi:predicted aldo/keto reductase-like oxidoreductase
MDRQAQLGGLPPVCRLGLASRGNTTLHANDVRRAIDRGVNFLNWCGQPDGLSRAVRDLGPRRESVVVAVQIYAHSEADVEREIDRVLSDLGSDYVDVVTYYYLERESEWRQIIEPGSAHDALLMAREKGKLRLIGVTSHQRPLAATTAESGKIDLLMIRYNAAHRGAEKEIFPITDRLRIPILAYTCLRWGALLQPTPDDPPNFSPPPAPEWYRFVLSNLSVSVALAAPDGREELDEDLSLLDDWRPCGEEELKQILAHGDRVYRHAGAFP